VSVSSSKKRAKDLNVPSDVAFAFAGTGNSGQQWSKRSPSESAGTQRRCREADEVRRRRVRLYRSDRELVRLRYPACLGNAACKAMLAAHHDTGNTGLRNRRRRWMGKPVHGTTTTVEFKSPLDTKSGGIFPRMTCPHGRATRRPRQRWSAAARDGAPPDAQWDIGLSATHCGISIHSTDQHKRPLRKRSWPVRDVF
jgi:hypothetical protein